MNKPTRGFSSLLILLVVAILVAGGAYYYFHQLSGVSPVTATSTSATASSTSSTITTPSSTSRSSTNFRWVPLANLTAAEKDGFTVQDGKVYYGGAAIPGADPSKLQVGIYGTSTAYLEYVKDDKMIYASDLVGIQTWNYDQFPQADYSTFTPVLDAHGVPSYFGKDKNHVFDGQALLSSADPKTFVVLDDALGEVTEYGKDANHVYIWNVYNDNTKDEIIDGADAKSFTANIPLPPNKGIDIDVGGYAKDINYVYGDGFLMKDLNPAKLTFKLDSNGHVTNLVTDGTFTYEGGNECNATCSE